MAKKIFAFIMAAVLACTALAGCTAQKDADTAKENITTTKKVTDDSNFKLILWDLDTVEVYSGSSRIAIHQRRQGSGYSTDTTTRYLWALRR